MQFTEVEKLSILKAMDVLIKADTEIHDKEVEFLEAIVDEFGWNPGFMEKLESFKKEDAIAAVEELSDEKLTYFQELLKALAESDQSMNEAEMNFLEKANNFIISHKK